ncbi:MAG: hypothetical protein FWD53_10940 [Phycisphaerales bacterium]|nr:hypothetical protein [Phycisphaerales bacterium]
MTTLRFETMIDEMHTLSLVLPSNVRPGKAEVVVTVDVDEPNAAFTPMTNEEFDELMHFGDGRRLGDISLKELIAEGRR